MADRQAAPSRGTIAAHFDATTLAIFVTLVGLLACSVLEIGPVVALDRFGCRINDGVNAFRADPRPCH